MKKKTPQNQNPSPSQDTRPLSVDEVLSALHKKFSQNFTASKAEINKAGRSEQLARSLSVCASHLEELAGDARHRKLLAKYLDEIFADSVCALYLAGLGLTVPARTLLRRLLELGVVVLAYWDSPADFWNWRDHDGDIRFSELNARLTSNGYATFLSNLPRPTPVDARVVFGGINFLYGELSNVVHPKPYNFVTTAQAAYAFDEAAFAETIRLAEQVYSSLYSMILARFPELSHESPT